MSSYEYLQNLAAPPSLEDVMVEVASYVEEHGGEVRDEPGELIRHIAEALFGGEYPPPVYKHPEYCRTARAVVELERIDILIVERYNNPRGSEKGNLICALILR